jgi:hypothetical protein
MKANTKLIIAAVLLRLEKYQQATTKKSVTKAPGGNKKDIMIFFSINKLRHRIYLIAMSRTGKIFLIKGQ